MEYYLRHHPKVNCEIHSPFNDVICRAMMFATCGTSFCAINAVAANNRAIEQNSFFISAVFMVIVSLQQTNLVNNSVYQ